MPSHPVTIRIFLAALLCAGLCRLDWGQIHDSPDRTSDALVIREVAYEQWDLFAALSTESVAAHAQPVRGETVPFIFGFEKPLTASVPVMGILSQVSLEVPEAKSVHGECLRNKDPPPFDGLVSQFPAFVLNTLKLSSHETPFSRFARLVFASLLIACALSTSQAQETAPAAPAEPTVEQRLADLEAYVNNTARTPDVVSKIPGPGPGHNAWQMVSTALVIFMTLPGLALFYGGLVGKKNVLSVLAQCMGIAGLVTILWWAIGYSLAFGGGNAFIGDATFAFLNGVEPGNVGAGYYWISDSMWAMFQLSFAIITPALIVGAIAERMKFSAVLVFVALWMFAVYFPFAHMVWSGTGFMSGILNAGAGIKAIDFAGGTVVHMTSGWSALVLCIILGKRNGFGKIPMPPHSLVLCTVGTGMLWVGWYGFNAGSALGADAIASNAFATTTLAAAVAGFVWGMAEWVLKGHPSVLGFCSGIVAGLVVITPGAGFVSMNSAVLIGALAGFVPFIAVSYLKKILGYDDALDTFGVHGVGGTMGAILTGVFADEKINSVVGPLKEGLLAAQLKACVLTIVWSVVATAIIAYIVKFTIGLRPSPEAESAGLDTSEHGEEGYIG